VVQQTRNGEVLGRQQQSPGRGPVTARAPDLRSSRRSSVPCAEAPVRSSEAHLCPRLSRGSQLQGLGPERAAIASGAVPARLSLGPVGSQLVCHLLEPVSFFLHLSQASCQL